MEYEKLVIEINEVKTKRYYLNSKYHRLDGAAIEWYDGSKSWWVNGKRYRLDGLAVEWRNGTKEYRVNGELVVRSEQEQPLHNETTKLGSINWFIDFVARCDILLL